MAVSNYIRVIRFRTDKQHGVELGKGERETFPDDYEAVACTPFDLLGKIRTTWRGTKGFPLLSLGR